jgi:hypothetical protein
MALYRVRADGAGDVERLSYGGLGPPFHMSYSADGRMVALELEDEDAVWANWIVRLDGDREPARVGAGFHPQLSRDGRWLAYAYWETPFAVYVQSTQSLEAERSKVSAAGGAQPQWSADGRELYYRTDAGAMVVDVEIEAGEFRSSRPRVLFEGAFSGKATGVISGNIRLPDFAAAPDGQSFYIVSELDPAVHRHVIVSHWLDELRELVPAER